MHMIKQVSPILKNDIQDAYTFIRVSCDSYDNLSFDEFNKCRNSIYYLEDSNNIISGIIACCNITLDEIPIDKLKYYCKPNKELYMIRVLHFLYGTDTSDMIRLIKECIADKNDGFIYIDPSCPILDLHILEECGFTEYSINGKVTFIKEPTLSK